MNSKKRLGKWMLYILCLAPAALMLAYYWLEFVPRQHEYFVNLRFRSLAVMGENLSTKIERLGSSYQYAIGGKVPPDQYISALVPDLTYLSSASSECPSTGSQPPGPQAGKVEIKIEPGKVKFTETGKKACPAEALLSQIVSGFNQEDLFDDLLIADGENVVYQRSVSSPRIVALKDLLKTSGGASVATGQGNGREADAVRTVMLDESEFTLLTQPLRIAALGPGNALQMCGLVRSDRLGREARHVPPAYLLVLFAPLLIVSLSSPFLKVLLLTRTGRLAFHDIAMLGLFTVIGTAMITLLAIYAVHHELNERRPEPDLARFANAVNGQLVSDMQRMWKILDQFDKALPKNIGQSKDPDRKDIASLANFASLSEDLDPFDFVFWTNEDGCQVAKWTTARFPTRRFPQNQQDSFQNVLAKRLWSVGPDEPITLQTLVSQTTSRLIVVAAAPSNNRGRQAPCEEAQPTKNARSSKIVSVSLVAQLRSLSSPLVPPDAGFAVFEPNGRVLFHSQSSRNLHEILFEEIRDPEPWREAVAMRAERSDTAYYRGRKFQFRVQPVKGVAGNNWSIAVFQEIEPRQARIGLVWIEALLLFGLELGLIGIAAIVVITILGGRGLPWRGQVDFFLGCLWPERARRPLFRRLAWELTAIVLVSTIVVAAGSRNANRDSVWLLPFCLLMPLGAIGFTAWRLWRRDPACGSASTVGGTEIAYFACMSLCLGLLAVAPTIGLWSVCEAYETRAHVRRWQYALEKSAEVRRSQMQADIESSRALSDEAKKYFLARTAIHSASREEKYVGSFWGTFVGGEAARAADAKEPAEPCQSPPGHGDQLKLSCLAGAGPPIEVTSTLPHAAGGDDWLQPEGVNPPDEKRQIATGALWGALALALLAGYAWNCKTFGRLFLLNFRYCPLPPLTSLQPGATLSNHLMVLGLSLSKKDKAVCNWLGYTPPRVNLYTAHLSKWWIKETTAKLQRELAAELLPIARAAAAGGSVPSGPPVPLRNWVHVSNLEVKLSEAGDRQLTADLIESLITMDLGGTGVRLVVTSAVDPVSHFDSVLNDERKKIYEHPLPEPELQRLARLLHNFRKFQAPGADPRLPEWAESAAGAIIYEECRYHQPLLEIGGEVAWAAPPGCDADMLLAMVAERARALYKLYWSCCTRSEKLLLIQIAQTGLVNPFSLDTLQELMRKGLVLLSRRPRIMNESFRRFLETVEGPDTVRQWESEAGESTWLIVRNIVLVLIVIGLGVVGVTQVQFMQNTAAALTGAVTLIAGLSRLLGYFSARRSGAAVETA